MDAHSTQRLGRRVVRTVLFAGALVVAVHYAGCLFPISDLRVPTCDGGQCPEETDAAVEEDSGM